MMKNSLRRKADIIFVEILTIGILFSAVFVFGGSVLYFKAKLFLEVFSANVNDICGCSNHLAHLDFFNNPLTFVFWIILAGGLIFFAIGAMIKTRKISGLTSRFIKLNIANGKKIISSKLQKAVKIANIDSEVIEAKNEEAIIFCFGFFRKKICVSSKLVEKLSIQELAAVLLHEKSHIRNNDPLKLFAVKIISGVLFFVPGIDLLQKQFILFSELSADEFAACDFQKRDQLIKAFYKMLKLKEEFVVRNGAALSFFTITEERITQLVDHKHNPSLNLSFTWFIISAALLSILSFLFFNIAHSQNFDKNNYQMSTYCIVSAQENPSFHSCEKMSCESGHNHEMDLCLLSDYESCSLGF